MAESRCIKPGPCPLEGCPPPTEIVCLKVKKVYEECKQLETDPSGRAFQVPVIGITVPTNAETCVCRIKRPTVISLQECWKHWWLTKGAEYQAAAEDHEALAEKMDWDWLKKTGCCKVERGRVKVFQPKKICLQLEVEFFDGMGNPLGMQQGFGILEGLTPEKIIPFARAGEPRIECEVDIFLDSIGCFIQEDPIRQVICCINVIKVVKLFAEVQILVPAYGFCPEPPECEEGVLGECPEAVQFWPPFPPQEEDDNCHPCR